KRRLILAVAKAIADDIDTIINHRVEQRLEARARTRKWRVVDDDLRSRCEAEDRFDAEQHVALVWAKRRAAIDMYLAHLTDQVCGEVGSREPVGDIAQPEAAKRR